MCLIHSVHLFIHSINIKVQAEDNHWLVGRLTACIAVIGHCARITASRKFSLTTGWGFFGLFLSVISIFTEKSKRVRILWTWSENLILHLDSVTCCLWHLGQVNRLDSLSFNFLANNVELRTSPGKCTVLLHGLIHPQRKHRQDKEIIWERSY